MAKTINPFDTPVTFSEREGRESFAGGPLGAPVVAVRERLQEDARRHAKALEIQNATLKAELENARSDCDKLQRIVDAHGAPEPSASQQENDKALRVERERAKSLERELVNVRQLQVHTVAAGALNRATLALAVTNLGEIATLLGVDADGDGAQIRRAIELLVTRSAVLDSICDNVIDDMSSAAKAMLTDLQPNFGKGRATGELQTIGALSSDDEGRWNWTTIGEVLRQRRAEHLGTQRRTGEYQST